MLFVMFSTSISQLGFLVLCLGVGRNDWGRIMLCRFAGFGGLGREVLALTPVERHFPVAFWVAVIFWKFLLETAPLLFWQESMLMVQAAIGDNLTFTVLSMACSASLV